MSEKVVTKEDVLARMERLRIRDISINLYGDHASPEECMIVIDGIEKRQAHTEDIIDKLESGDYYDIEE